jgi:hypothetical protein
MSGDDIADALGGEFDASKEAPAEDRYGLLETGWYPLEVEKAEVKENNARNGKFLKLQVTVIGERHNGRKLFPQITLSNPNPDAVRIGRRELADLTQAAGITVLKNSAELVGKQVDGRVGIKKGNEGYPDDNKVSTYAVLGSKSSGEQATAPRKKGGAKAPPATAWGGQQAPAPAQQAPATETQAQAPAATKPAGKMPWE